MKKHLLFLALLFPVCLHAQMKINELMTNNVSAVMDDGYNYSMWVELYNSSPTATLSQSKYYLTDNLSVPRKWNPGVKYMAPNSYSVLWFERDEKAGHANFKLNPEGGKLYLLDYSLHVVDSVHYPGQYRNISFGRKTDASTDWVYFEQYSPGVTNNGKSFAQLRCKSPEFTLKSGFYPIAQTVDFVTPEEGDTIYYTKNGTEPTRKTNRYVPGTSISLPVSCVLRAKTFSKNKLSSDVVASSFFMNTRNHHLPVVSISTQPANLTDNTIGIYVVGTNGITGNGNSTPVNFNQPWDRPANFELFDTSGVSCLNQELDISIAGAYTRNNPQKSLKIQPRKKFGDSQLRYDFFSNAKPNRKYKDILLRNSGNDFYYSMMRDGFIQTLVSKRMDLDLLAYQPAVFYLNANYWGIQNLREESSSDFLYSNYGLEDDQVNLLETGEIPDNALYKPLRDFVSGNDMTKASIYDRVCQLMDVDQFINYMISEIYIGNTDWPYNNIKIWRKKDGGKWRWILYDTDFGFGLYDSNLHNHNTLLYALGEKADQLPPDWSTLLLRRLMLNETFRNKFLDRFSIQISSTFETNRVNAIMDSLASKIAGEIDYHRTRWFIRNRSFAEELGIMKTFSAQRPDLMMGFLSSRFANSAPIRTVQLSSNVTGASYRMNTEAVMDSEVRLKYFKGRKMELQANPVFGYRFKQWETLGTQNQELVQMGAIWKYFDGAAIPASNWNTTAYSDAVWKSGPSQLGYGNKGEKTLISYGNDVNAKYTTAYFRKTVSITDLPRKDNFSITMIVDDGAAVYVNGHEVGRHLLAAGALTFNTFSTAANNSDTVTFSVPTGYLREGDNLIAVEVHQTSLFSSDCVFNLKMTCNVSGTTAVLTDPVFSVILDNDVKLQAIYEKTTTELPKEEATIVLNELVASNNTYPDEFGVREDYIELYNTGDKDVNVAGWYLSDTPANRMLWQIPVNDLSKTLVPAKGRIVFWADNEPLQGTMHLGFKLGKEGETVLLARKDLSGSVLTVDSVSYPALDVNLSYSRIPDGGPNWYADLPTFQAKNNDIVAIEQPKTEVLSTVELYPTLVTEAFTVCHATGKTIILTDLTGKRMLSRQSLTDETVVEAGFLQPGLYLVNIGNQRFKIIKR